MRRPLLVLVLAACGSHEPSATPRGVEPAHDVALDPVAGSDAGTDAASSVDPTPDVEPTSPIAQWSSRPVADRAGSPACSAAWSDRFVQYADLDDRGDPRFCLWWNLQQAAPEVGCWRVDLAARRYVAEGGVWFSAPQPQRVGTGGPELPPSPLTAHWRDGSLEVCRGPACKVLPFAQPPDRHDEDVALDPGGALAVVPLPDPPGGKARSFATVELASGARLATLQLADHGGLVVAGFLGTALVVTDCDEPKRCVWDLYDPRRGVRIAAVGGAKPLGLGGTMTLVDDHRLAAVAGHTLVIQDLTSGQVLARRDLPVSGKSRADYVVLGGRSGVLALGPDGRVLSIDAAGTITRSILPPRCAR